MMRPAFLVLAIAAAAAAVVSADVHAGASAPNPNVSGALRMPVVFSANMVLQRSPANARVWGWTTPNTGVTVAVAGQSKTATADAAGAWLVALDAVSGGATAYTLTVKDATGNSVAFANVLFGDVYLCSGQSNMQFTVSQANNASDEIADSVHYPLLRVFSVAQKASLVPLYDVTSKAPYQWGVSSPAVIGGPDWQYFSASCYFFGRELYKSLAGALPIGLVDSDWGGTYVQAWSSPDALAKCNSSAAVADAIAALGDSDLAADLARFGGDAADALLATRDADTLASDAQSADPYQFVSRKPDAADPQPNTPSVLWNGMIVPLLNMRFAGAAWYQGEANAGAPVPYACQFPAMIADWRVKFGLALPFFFVQLAPYLDDTSFPALRWAQTAALALPQTGMAVAIDLGDPSSPYGSIHPRYKQAVGLRLARHAQAVVYNQNVARFGPALAGWSMYEANGVASFAVTFDPESGAQLKARGTTNCELCCATSAWQWLNNATQQWLPVEPQAVTVSGQTVTVAVWTDGADAGALSYAWQQYPECLLYNDAGLPGPEFTLTNS